MKILVVQESDWLDRGPHQSHHLLERMVKKGHEVHVIDFEISWNRKENQDLYARRFTKKNVYKVVPPGITLVRPSMFRIPIFDYFSVLFFHHSVIKSEVELFRPDIIIGFGLLNNNIAIKIAQQARIPFCYYVIDQLHQLVPHVLFKPIAKIIEQKNLRTATYVFTINKKLREYCLKMGGYPTKISVLPAGVDLQKFENINGREIRAKLNFNDDDVILFFMGWLYDFSGLDALVIELAKCENKKIKLLIIGKGELKNNLNKIVKSLYLENVVIVDDWKPYSEIPNYLAAVDICVLPSKNNEIMKNIVPIKIYEYLAAGKPVITTKLPGIYLEFGEGNGIQYEDQISKWPSIISDLIKNDLIRSEGLKGKHFVSSHDWSGISDKFESKLLELINTYPKE